MGTTCCTSSLKDTTGEVITMKPQIAAYDESFVPGLNLEKKQDKEGMYYGDNVEQYNVKYKPPDSNPKATRGR